MLVIRSWMMISTLNFQFNLAQLALKFLGGLNLVLGGAKARLAPPPVEPPLLCCTAVYLELKRNSERFK
jgi:hypothetical protein